MDRKKLHIIGVGGTAMVAGARLALEKGWEVRGSDGPLYPPTSEIVKSLGILTYEGFRGENLDWGPDLVLVGNALSRGNAEVEELLRRRIPYMSLPEWMKGELLWQRKPVVIAGTHGKTTTTALTAFLFDRCGLDPGFMIGGQALDFEVTARTGAPGAPFVIEGDEYDTAFFDKRAKFFHYLPEIAVITSIEFDHADIFDSIEQIENSFRLMLRQLPSGGLLLACADNSRALAAAKEHRLSEVQTYGFSPESFWRGEFKEYVHGMAHLRVLRQDHDLGVFRVPLAGRHNLQNALAAIAAASVAGAELEQIRTALPAFRGVRRRMELFLQAGGVSYIDDFAHHPTAIRATITAARERWPGGRLLVLLEPRSNTMVQRIHADALAEALQGADGVWLGAIHRPERFSLEERLPREKILASLRSAGAMGAVCDDVTEIVRQVNAAVRPGDVVLVLSNGAFGGIHERFRAEAGVSGGRG